MGGVSKVRIWSQRAALAAALILWAVGSFVGSAQTQGSHDGGLSGTHLCAPSTDGREAPPASSHHHCSSCLLCSFRDLADAVIAPGEPHFLFAPRLFALAQWPAHAFAVPHRRDLIAQLPRAPPSFS